MTKYVPSLTKGKTYDLSLIAINQHGTRCDLIYSYIDDEGDEMFLREFTETFIHQLQRVAIWNRGNCTELLRRNVKMRGAYRLYTQLHRCCIKAELALNFNGSTGHYYTVITKRIALSDNYRLPETIPSFWLTDEYFYGDAGLAELDYRHQRAMYLATAELEERAEIYESGEFQREPEEAIMESMN